MAGCIAEAGGWIGPLIAEYLGGTNITDIQIDGAAGFVVYRWRNGIDFSLPSIMGRGCQLRNKTKAYASVLRGKAKLGSIVMISDISRDACVIDRHVVVVGRWRCAVIVCGKSIEVHRDGIAVGGTEVYIPVFSGTVICQTASIPEGS